MNPTEVWHNQRSGLFLVVELENGVYRTLYSRLTFHDACNDAGLWLRRN